jgi:acyl carrier protein
MPLESVDAKTLILTRLQAIFRDVLGEDVALDLSTVAADVDGWDSLSHISLMLAVEESFGIRFVLGESQKAKNVGELVELIAAKQKKA